MVPATDAEGQEEATRHREMRKRSCRRSGARSGSSRLSSKGPHSEEAEGSRSGRSPELPVALRSGVHVVPDADGLFEKTLHAAEVEAAVHQVLHGAETGGRTGQCHTCLTLPVPGLPMYPPYQRLVGGPHGLRASKYPADSGTSSPRAHRGLQVSISLPCVDGIHPIEHMMARSNF